MAPPHAVHIIDDDEAVRHSLATLLQTRGFAVAAYGSGRAFLDAVGGAVAGCVVTDVQMPGMTGLDLMRALRRRGVAAPVIMVTARTSLRAAVAAKAEGAVVVEKPFAPEAFVEIVRRTLEASPVPGRAAPSEPAPAGSRPRS